MKILVKSFEFKKLLKILAGYLSVIKWGLINKKFTREN